MVASEHIELTTANFSGKSIMLIRVVSQQFACLPAANSSAQVVWRVTSEFGKSVQEN